MSRFLNELEKACKSAYHKQIGTAVWKYVCSGDEKFLAAAKPQASRFGMYWARHAWRFMPSPEDLTEEESRALHANVVMAGGRDLAEVICERIKKAPETEAACLEMFLAAFGKKSNDQVAAAIVLVEDGPPLSLEGTPGPIASFLLSLSDKQMKSVMAKCEAYNRLLAFLIARDPKRVAPVAATCLSRHSTYREYSAACSAAQLLQHNAAEYEAAIAKVLRSNASQMDCFMVGVELTRFKSKKYQAETRQIGETILEDAKNRGDDREVCRWLVEQFGKEALEKISRFLGSNDRGYYAEPILQDTVAALGENARQAVVAALTNASSRMRLAALEQLIQWNAASDRKLISEGLVDGFGSKDPQVVIRFLVAAGRWDIACVEDAVWDLLKHKSKPVRETAARTLGRQGDDAVPRGGELLAAKKAATRSCAVTLLATAATDKATKLLEGRLDEEGDEEVRDQMLLALETVWEAKGKKISQKEIDRRIERTLPKINGPIAPWLDESQLPPLKYARGGKTMPTETVRYLLYRQSRAKEMRADVEAKPLFALIDRASSGPFALAVLQQFTGSMMEAYDRWALAVAGLLGDDRVVTPLMQQIRTWVEGGRGKMAEYAAQALALVGSDVALCAVDALSIRYRSKQKNIGKAASESFAEAAERLGITIEELGDRVVPWLGFEPNSARIIEHGDKRIEVGIGMDFKPSYRDLVKEKKIKSLPGAIPAEIKKEYTELAATLREVVKGQLVRLENLMVRQFRWPRDRWCELYLGHPLLRPFGVRLVWGTYGSDGKLQKTFRALEDGTLTDEEDEQFELPKKGKVLVGIVHPLELSPEERQAWATHLADYEIQSPFLQLERPVVFPSEKDKQTTMSSDYQGTSINAMTFKGRAERLGWQRGSVCDGGGITCYCKSFPDAGADAILGVEDMYIGIDMYSDIALGQFCFVRAGSVQWGSYMYDEPSQDTDPRLLPFGEVPPIVYSEILGDLGKIAGQKAGEEE